MPPLQAERRCGVRHVVLTRSAYGPGWDLDANRRRLAITVGITVRSLAAQTNKDWTWIVAVTPKDPLLRERYAAFESVGVPVRFVDFESGNLTPGDVAFDAYRAAWPIGPRDETVLMTRLDDDDAFTPDAFARLRKKAASTRGRAALMFPHGFRVLGSGYTPVTHLSNAMHSLLTPPGDMLDVYAYGHRHVAETVRVVHVDQRPAWLWVRHPDSISGWKHVEKPLTPQVRRLFPIDWSLLTDCPTPRTRKGRIFR